MEPARHDHWYALDSSRLRAKLGWTPGYADFALGLTATVEWSRANVAWLRPLKGVTEARYAAAAGR